ncbi:serine/threonine protein kinase [Ancylothrix sp. C2]|uniref:serine/threonine-protein kinase n=1 Tax=Ancylothrix sp. D3o TaxID=2953691 RepID=UPI0021BB6688|nr:serine/threonine-protein kinase [Ancylothrix sp. D3o]MCT7953041.1 serine/threonine protein kinase [Ancylothrix sp. D3o]
MILQILRGRYHVIKPLSSGGFGETFLAEDWDLPAHPICVVKRFQPQSNSAFVLEQGARLFNQEAEILHRLGNHDQIPRLLAHFEENGEFYLVEEFVEGEVLSNALVSGGRWAENEVIKLLRDVFEVLAFVHSQGVIHRDIKPANLIRRKSDGKIVLIDFGAVKEIGGLTVSNQGQVMSTIMIGTSGYMPDEQANGKPRFSSDVYAVGVIAIQALTGLNPDPSFGGFPEDAVTGEISWRNLVPVSGNLGDVIDKMVCKDYRQRYVSAVEVVAMLDALVGAKNQAPTLVSAVPTLPSTQVSKPPFSIMSLLKWPRDHKMAFAGLCLAVVGILVTLFETEIKRSIGLEKTGDEVVSYEGDGIKVKYPEKWEKQVYQGGFYGNGVVFVSPKDGKDDKFPERVALQVISNQSASKFYENLRKERQEEIGEILPKVPQTTTLAKGEANSVVSEDRKDQVKSQYVWREVNGKLYVLTYAAESGEFSNYQPKFEKIKDSLEIR